MLQNDIDPVSYIDYALLDPTASNEQVDRVCEEADRFGFASVCVYPCNSRLKVRVRFQVVISLL